MFFSRIHFQRSDLRNVHICDGQWFIHLNKMPAHNRFWINRNFLSGWRIRCAWRQGQIQRKACVQSMVGLLTFHADISRLGYWVYLVIWCIHIWCCRCQVNKMYIQQTRADSVDKKHFATMTYASTSPKHADLLLLLFVTYFRRHGSHFVVKKATQTHTHATLQLICANSLKFRGSTAHTDTQCPPDRPKLNKLHEYACVCYLPLVACCSGRRVSVCATRVSVLCYLVAGISVWMCVCAIVSWRACNVE